MNALISAIEYYLPRQTLTTQDLALTFPEWSVEKIDAKTGIHTRHVASDDETASDLAVEAAIRLFDSGACTRQQIDFVLLCTQSGDYVLPSTACLIQDRLSIPVSAGALDYNLGCSGFVYGLGLAEGLIVSGQARAILLLTADTYTKYLDEEDKSARTIFGDGAAATLLTAQQMETPSIGPFIYGTDGRGWNALILPDSGSRRLAAMKRDNLLGSIKARGNESALFMDGARIFKFATETVPQAVNALLAKANLSINSVDLVVFHQANQYLLEELGRQLGFRESQLQITLGHCANTVSSSIPIALKHASIEGRIGPGSTIMIVGFGVGYSWGATIIKWNDLYK